MIFTAFFLAGIGVAPEMAVKMELTVAPDGSVTDCVVVESQATEPLNSETCRIFREKGRFRPAMDTEGRPIASKIPFIVRYRLPVARNDPGDRQTALTPPAPPPSPPPVPRAR